MCCDSFHFLFCCSCCVASPKLALENVKSLDWPSLSDLTSVGLFFASFSCVPAKTTCSCMPQNDQKHSSSVQCFDHAFFAVLKKSPFELTQMKHHKHWSSRKKHNLRKPTSKHFERALCCTRAHHESFTHERMSKKSLHSVCFFCNNHCQKRQHRSIVQL